MGGLECSEVDGVGVLRLARPERSNAVDLSLLEDLSRAVRGQVRPVAVIAAAGNGAFCGGADLVISDDDRATLSDGLYGLYRDLVTSPVIWICAVGGAAVGAGAQIAIACDVRVAGPRARFRFAGPGHGLSVGMWGLPSLVGRGRALEICLTMRDVEAAEAHSIGLVERRADDPLDDALRLGVQLSELEARARGRLKRQLVDGLDLVGALEAERSGNAGWDGAVPARVAHDDSDLEGWRRRRLREEVLAEAPRAVARLKAKNWPGAAPEPVPVRRLLGARQLRCWTLDVGPQVDEDGAEVEGSLLFFSDGGFGSGRQRSAGLDHLDADSLEQVLKSLRRLG